MLWWKVFDLTGISTLIIHAETRPEFFLETSECKVKPPHNFLVQKNFQSMIVPDQFCIAKFRPPIWLCKMGKADRGSAIWQYFQPETWEPLKTQTQLISVLTTLVPNRATPESLPSTKCQYSFYNFTLPCFHDLTLILVIITAWSYSQPHQNLQKLVHVAVTWVLLTGVVCLNVHISTKSKKSLKTRLPVKLRTVILACTN